MRQSSKRRIALAFTLLLAVTGFFTAVGAVFCAATLHVQRRTGAAPDAATGVQIVAKDHAILKAWWFQPKVSNGGCLIVLHGIGDSRASSSNFAPMFSPQGYSVLAPDSRAHGDSGGQFVTYGLLERYDILAWARWMRHQNCRRLYGLGESLGGSILIQASALEPRFNAIVAECPFADLKEMAEFRIQRLVKLPHLLSPTVSKVIVETGMLYARVADGLDFRQVSPLQSMQSSSTPILLIHGLDDQRTPPEQSRMLASVGSERDRLWLVPGLDIPTPRLSCRQNFAAAFSDGSHKTECASGL